MMKQELPGRYRPGRMLSEGFGDAKRQDEPRLSSAGLKRVQPISRKNAILSRRIFSET